MRANRSAVVIAGDKITELGQQRLEFGAATVNVTDDVEWSGVRAHIVQILTVDNGVVVQVEEYMAG
jgi:hypothetical protein